MEMGGFLLFYLLAAGLLVGGLLLGVAFLAGWRRRRGSLGIWIGGLILLIVLGRIFYLAYWLDERLFIAAAQGDAVQVKALLSAGARPDATWEDGTSALSAARRGGHKNVVILLERAGATR